MNKQISVKTLFLFSGYAEEQSNACVVVTHKTGFKTVLEALTSVAQVFVNVDAEASVSACCAASMKTADYKWCPLCGTKLERNTKAAKSIEGLDDRCNDFLYGNINDSAEIYDRLEEFNWTFDLDNVNVNSSFTVCSLPDVLELLLTAGNIDELDYCVTKVK